MFWSGISGSDFKLKMSAKAMEEYDMRLNVVVADDFYEEFKKLADKKGKSVSELVRDAMRFEIWLQQVGEMGGVS